jgi:hypothetical protein
MLPSNMLPLILILPIVVTFSTPTGDVTHDLARRVGLLELKSTVHFPELSNCPRISWYSLPQNP